MTKYGLLDKAYPSKRSITARVITEYAKAIKECLPEYKITIVIRDPREATSVHSVLVVTDDEPKKVLEALFIGGSK